MRIVTRSTKVFNFDELTETAKNNARYYITTDFCTPAQYASETLKSARVYAEYLSFYIRYSEIDNAGAIDIYIFSDNENINNLTGARAIAWLQNNFEFKKRPKYAAHIIHCDEKKNYLYIGKAAPLKRYDFNYLTGYCDDYCFLIAYNNFIAAMRENGANKYSIYDFCKMLSSEFSRAYNEQIYYFYTDDCINEMCECNNIEFTETGNIF